MIHSGIDIRNCISACYSTLRQSDTLLQIPLRLRGSCIQCAQTLCYPGFNRDIIGVPTREHFLLLNLSAHDRDLASDALSKINRDRLCPPPDKG